MVFWNKYKNRTMNEEEKKKSFTKLQAFQSMLITGQFSKTKYQLKTHVSERKMQPACWLSAELAVTWEQNVYSLLFSYISIFLLILTWKNNLNHLWLKNCASHLSVLRFSELSVLLIPHRAYQNWRKMQPLDWMEAAVLYRIAL